MSETVGVLPVTKVEDEKPTPPPFVQPAKVERLEEEEPRFVSVEKDETLEQLRNNIEEEIKRAGEPVDRVIELLEKWEELNKSVLEGGSAVRAWMEFGASYGKVQRSLGEAKGYRAALASSVLAFVLERRRK